MQLVKKYFFVLLIISQSNYLFAQQWALPNTVWRYNFKNLSGVGFVSISVVKDTVVDGINTVKINKRVFRENAFTGQIQSFNEGDEFTHISNGIVFLRFQDGFDTLYNFNALPGQSWEVPGNSPISSICNDVSRVVVIDTSSVEIEGVLLKQLIVNYEYRSSGPFLVRDTIIERIGTIGQYLLPWDRCLATQEANEGGNLRCFEDIDIANYKSNFYSECEVIVSVRKNNSLSINLFPNPVDDYLFMTTPIPVQNLTLKIYDVYGKIKLHQVQAQNRIEVQSLSSGLYFIELQSNGTVLNHSRFIKL